jgi:hypothetical protein
MSIKRHLGRFICIIVTFNVTFMLVTILTDWICQQTGYYEELAWDESDY